MTELWLFIIVGAIAVFAAVMMLLSENAVYSALYLILTMGCIAFLFLLLDAPFLAMVQITVYAGAIMILFVFVIMLLGAERFGAGRPRFRWLTPLGVVAALAFLMIMGLGVLSGGIDLQTPPSDAPQLRVINLAADSGPIDVYANDRLIASGIGFNSGSDFVTLEPGDYEISITPAEGETFGGSFTFDPDTVQALVAYGSAGDIALSVIPADFSTPEKPRSGRVTFFNANPDYSTVTVYDLGPNGELDTNTQGVVTDRVIAELAPGEASEPILYEEGIYRWAFVTPNSSVIQRIISGDTGREYRLERETSQLVAFANERSIIDDQLHPTSAAFRNEAAPAFGSPMRIGRDLFTRFLLPFELVSLLLLVAMIGAIVLTHREEARVRDRAALRRRVSRPLASVIASQVGRDISKPDAETPALPPAEGRTPAGD